jgi:predicted CopG family antitoxin
MATKTISLELDAYEKLKRAKRGPRESFSSVVRRAIWPEECRTAAQLLAFTRKRMEEGLELPELSVIEALERGQKESRISQSKW